MKNEIKKSDKLDGVRYEIRGEAVDMAAQMELEGEQIIRLNIGNLAPYGFDAPKEVIGDVVLNLRKAQGYTESKGIFPARKAIMQYYQLQNLPNLNIENIFLGNGVSEMIIMSMQALLNAGDEMLVPSPDYPLWSAAVNLAGGKAVHYGCKEEEGWIPDLEDMRAKITPRTRGIIVINPNNPTGAVYPRSVLEQIVELAREFGLMLFSDEIYDHLIMDDIEFTSIASLAPDLFCATFNGLSKSYRVTGFRSGWLVFSGDVERGRDYISGINLLASIRLCPNAPAQHIIQTCIGGYQSVREFVEPGGRIYEQRDYVYQMLSAIPGISVVKPQAAFYIFPKYDKERFDFAGDEDFALQLLKEENVLVVPGSGFDHRGDDHFRIVYLPEISTLRTVGKRLTRFFERHTK